MDNSKDFCEFLLDNKYSLIDQPIDEIKPVFSGGETNPDGMLKLKGKDQNEFFVYLEIKTWRASLNENQLKNHLKKYCDKDNSLLLVITPRYKNKELVNVINKEINIEKVFFKTWSQIINKLKNINKSPIPNFVINQFIEYGKLSGDFLTWKI